MIQNRRIRQLIQITYDFIISTTAFFSACLLTGVNYTLAPIIWMGISIALARIGINYIFGSYRQIWRFTSFREIQNLGLNTILISTLLAPFIKFEIINLSSTTILIDAIIFFFGSSLLRIVRRASLLLNRQLPHQPVSARRTLFIGAGNTANMLILDIKRNPTNMHIIGILDDDPAKQGAEIHGIKVLGNTTDLETIIQDQRIQNIIITMPSANQKTVTNLVSRARKKGLAVKVAPNIYNLANGQTNTHQYTFRLDDLLDIKEIPASIREELDKDRENRVLITGGFGYIGTHLVKLLLDAGYQVRVLDNFVYGKAGLEGLLNHPHLEVIEGDVTSIKDVVRCVKNVNTVIALAAIVGDPACSLNAEETLNLNYEATKILVETANFYGVKRFIFASSCSVYGASNSDFLTEDSPLNPVSLYARTRIMSEETIFERCGTMKPIILRLSTVFGLSPRMRFDLVVNTLTVRGVVDGKFQIFGGNQWRPFIHCHDAARAFFLATKTPDDAIQNAIFNLGGNNMNYTLNEIGKIIEKEIPNVTIETKDSTDDPRNYKVKFDRIQNQLGFKPEISIQQGVKEMITAIKTTDTLKNYSDPKYSNVLTLQQAWPQQ